MARKPKITKKEIEQAIGLLEAQGIVEKDEEGLYTMAHRDIPSTNEIKMFFHCRWCIEELPRGQAPKDWRRLSVGFTELGMQVWCDRHECNIIHIDFEGQQHPANQGGYSKGNIQ